MGLHDFTSAVWTAKTELSLSEAGWSGHGHFRDTAVTRSSREYFARPKARVMPYLTSARIAGPTLLGGAQHFSGRKGLTGLS